MWFKRGLYPKAEQFADWLDSYFHKEEDTIPVAAVENLPAQLNNKYARTDGEALRQEHDTLAGAFAGHETANATDFEIVRDKLDELKETDAAIAVDLGTIGAMLKPGETLAGARSALVALGDSYRDLYAVASTLKTFLQSSDTAHATIDTWKEIETFLQGVTDTQSLTGLLSALEGKITTAYGAAIALSRSSLVQVDAEIRQEIAVVRQTVLALMAESAGRVIPLAIEITLPGKITLGNDVQQYIRAKLLPAFAVQNVIFLGDGKAVEVEPDGSVAVLGPGKSRVHVIPTENTSLHRTVEIEVVYPSFIKESAAGLLLATGQEILLT
jgi:hypothetical protein